MLKIRLSRRGKRKQPIFRVVVAEHTAPIKGKFIENLGYYKVTDKNKEISVKEDRITYWLENGAKASDAVAKILTNNSKGDFIKKFGLDKQVEIARSRPPRAKKSEDKADDQKAAVAPKQANENAVAEEKAEVVEEVVVENTEKVDENKASHDASEPEAMRDKEENKTENSENSEKPEEEASKADEVKPEVEPTVDAEKQGVETAEEPVESATNESVEF